MYRNRAPLALFLLCKSGWTKGSSGPNGWSITLCRINIGIQADPGEYPGPRENYELSGFNAQYGSAWRNRACGFRTDRRGPLGGDVGDLGPDLSGATASCSARGRTNRGNGI